MPESKGIMSLYSSRSIRRCNRKHGRLHGLTRENRHFVWDESYTPSHLLGLLRYYQSGPSRGLQLPGVASLSQSSSAIELAEVGIKLVTSKTTRFDDIGIREHILCGELFLAPLVMDDQNACWLMNMVAFEVFPDTAGAWNDTVSSYVYLLAALMSREEDVHELAASEAYPSRRFQ
ncbi:hypothetical protein E2562_032795 [Oryza meyeriana var. granulata]|uniref:Uncharacterized protein n=1 Tax=Oryza meyeriana var. granulata TaxID=110450 RepID=A0A6G1DPW3_9ORYZ|nr:hypothetical protein E2562_032795 [Oryza meyeriana var. granulata]